MRITNSYSTIIFTLLVLFVSISPVIDVHCNRNAAPESKAPIELDENNWTQILKGEWMVNFHAPWCPACKALKPEWEQFAEWSEDLNIKIASADVTENPGLSGRFMVSKLPTMFHVRDGVFRTYSGPRNHKQMINFVEKQEWYKVEPVSRWLAPDTLQMSFVGACFRLSMKLRELHRYFTDDLGIPYYVSYMMFAVFTVFMGTMLGLSIVLLIDLLITPEPAVRVDDSPPGRRKKTDDSKVDSKEASKEEKPSKSKRKAE